MSKYCRVGAEASARENVSGLHFLYHASDMIHDALKKFIFPWRLLDSTRSWLMKM